MVVNQHLKYLIFKFMLVLLSIFIITTIISCRYEVEIEVVEGIDIDDTIILKNQDNNSLKDNYSY